MIRKQFIQNYSIDDIHAVATAEFEDDDEAVRRLNAAYIEAQTEYLYVLMQLRSELEQQ